MSALGTEARVLAGWPDAERLSALKRIIPRRAVNQVLRQTGKDRSYCRCLPAWFMVWFMVAIGLFCGDCYRQVYRWLMRWSKIHPVPLRSTLCEARQRVGARPLALLLSKVVMLLADPQLPSDQRAFYRGMRLMALDGFTLDLPDTPANDRAFGRPSTGRAKGAFPQARVLGLCEAGTHVLWRVLVKRYHCGEITMTPGLLRHLQPGMLLLWDRNFFKYAHVREVLDRKANLLARVKNDITLRPLRRLGDGSYLSCIYRSKYDRNHDRNGILVRVIEYTLNDPNRPGLREKHRLLTTLLDEKRDPAKDLIELYHVRWEQELAIDELKTHEMERPVLRSQTPAGVVQEIYGLLLGHCVIRSLMHEAAKQQDVSPLRLSFVGALKILRCRLPECPRSRGGIQRWWHDLLEEIGAEQLPPRRDRINPRVIKRKMSNWKKKRPEHLRYPQPTKVFRDAIMMLN
jgi:Insertion element 4 transposase N-terminal/Transposase DDE domain